MSKCYRCGEELVGSPGEHTPCPADDIYGYNKNKVTQLSLPLEENIIVEREKPKAILSDGKYAIKAFQDRIEIWGIKIPPGIKLVAFNSIESLVKSIRLS